MPATPLLQSISFLTVQERVGLATDMLADLTNESGQSFYMGIGKNQPYPGANLDQHIEVPVESIDYENEIRRELCALKLLSISSASLVVRRNDWVANTTYDAFSNAVAMYSTTATVNANGLVSLTNTANVVGVNSTFLLDFANNSLMTLPGDGIFVLPQTREVINVVSNTVITVNLAFAGTFTNNIPQKITNSFPNYAKNFYVRNSYDQVFVCLDNNFSAKSTVAPVISLAGALPSSPFIITTDGYKWKYLYTMSGGMKQLFLTNEWMPVAIDINVLLGAVEGRLDIIKILNGGTGYNNGAASFSAPIINVVGDGTGANLTAQVDANGTITGINILNGGEDYTTVKITANSGLTGTNANITATIGPDGGWGSNAYLELGSTTAMFSVTLSGTESGTIPTTDALGDYFSYRQITLLANPVLTNGGAANSGNYDMSTVINVSGNTPFAMADIVYQSPTGLFANSTFVANVVWFDFTTNNLHINNPTGVFTPLSQLYGTKSANSNPYTTVVAFGIAPPLIDAFTGQILYIENRAPISRAPNQSENIKLVISF